jgi:hypothetical protein
VLSELSWSGKLHHHAAEIEEEKFGLFHQGL